MMRLSMLLGVIVCLLSFGSANAAVISSLVGDKDGFGLSGAPSVPADGVSWSSLGGSYGSDYRTASDLATAPFTDIWGYEQTPGGPLSSPIVYTHTYSLTGTAISALLYIQEAGMSDARGPWDVEFNGSVISSIGPYSAAEADTIWLLSFNVPTYLLTGSDTIRLIYQDTVGEGFAINFSELIIETAPAVPEPSTLLLLGSALAGVGLFRKRIANLARRA